MWGLSLVEASGGHSSSPCVGLSLSRPLPLRSTGSRRTGSVIVAHGPSRSAACGIFPDQGSNPCALHWQADSQPLCHQGSPKLFFNIRIKQTKELDLLLYSHACYLSTKAITTVLDKVAKDKIKSLCELVSRVWHMLTRFLTSASVFQHLKHDKFQSVNNKVFQLDLLSCLFLLFGDQ